MTAGEIVATCGGLAATGVATYFALLIEPLKNDLKAAKETRAEDKAAAEKQRDEDRAGLGARIDALHSDKKDLQKRLGDLERTALTRGELDTVRRDMEAAIDRMGDRVMKHFDDTTARLEKRIEHAERSHG